MLDSGFAPRAIAGSSAGALVGASYAAGLEPLALWSTLRSLRRADFWDPKPGLGLLRGELFRAKLDALLPADRFEDCRVPLAVSVYDVVGRRTQVRRSGPLAPAVHASCAVPAMFQPVWLEGRPYLDGGVSDRPGLAGVAPGARVLYHHLSSRSPWRPRHSPALRVPEREGLVAVVLDGLPRSGPQRLDAGRRAFEVARHAMQRALEAPVIAGVVRLRA